MATLDDNALHLQEAIHLARRSGIKLYQTGAVVIGRNGKVVSRGWSHYSLRTLSLYRSIHAELHAIMRAPTRASLVGADVYVATIRRKSENIGLARPCRHCLDCLFEVGVARAFYTVEGDEWDVLSVQETEF